MALAYNEGLRQAEGIYVNFCLATAEYSENIYKKVSGLFRRQPTPMVSCRPSLRNELGQLVPYGGSTLPKEKDEVEYLDLTPNRLQLNLQAYFFQRTVLEGHQFNETLHEDALPNFLLRLQLEHPKYCLAQSLHYYYTVALEDNTSINPLQYQRWWYDDSVNLFMLPLLQHAQETYGNVPRFLQYACYYLIYCKYNCNMNDRTKGVLKEKEEVLQFLSATGSALRYVDNGVIVNQGITSYTNANRALRMLLLRAKTDAMGLTWHLVDDGKNYLAIMRSQQGQPVADNDQAAVLRLQHQGAAAHPAHQLLRRDPAHRRQPRHGGLDGAGTVQGLCRLHCGQGVHHLSGRRSVGVLLGQMPGLHLPAPLPPSVPHSRGSEQIRTEPPVLL